MKIFHESFILKDLLKDEEFYNAYEDSFTVEVLITTVVDKR